MKATIKSITSAINRFLNAPTTDPDDARRRKLLNILLVGLTVAGVLGLVGTIVADIVDSLFCPVDPFYCVWESDQERITPYLGTIGMLVTTLVIYTINRYGSGWLASTLFLVIVIVFVALSDAPEEVAGGRQLLMFALPITMASVILRSYASFYAAGLSSLLLIPISLSPGWTPNPFAILLFFIIALVSWLAARSLEHALKDLRTLNVELDTRVAERTRQLAECTGELTEARELVSWLATRNLEQALEDLRILNAELDMRVVERTHQLAERTGELAEALEREQAEKSKTEAILDSTADGIVVFDAAGRATVANPALAGLLGQPPEAIVGVGIEDLVSEAVEIEDRETITGLLAGDAPSDTPGVKLGWGAKTLSITAAPVRLESGEKLGTVAVFRDFTREAEIDRMKSAFVSIASHDLRTPLGAILSYAGILYAGIGGSLTDDQRDIVEGIVSAAEQMRTLANNLLDRAQIEAGMFSLHVALLSPADLIANLENVMGPMAEARGLDLGCHVEDDVPGELSGDRQRLQQILMNLVDNAVKFTEEGAVGVRIYLPDADHWAMAVSDTGRGIPQEAQQVIFEPFRKADDTSQAHGGAGLGLSIVKQLVDLMEGEILLESTVGRGSTFTVVLPLGRICSSGY